MGKRKSSLTEDLIGFTVATPIAGAAIQQVGGVTGLPPGLVKGTQSLIGVGLLKGAADIAQKKKSRLL